MCQAISDKEIQKIPPICIYKIFPLLSYSSTYVETSDEDAIQAALGAKMTEIDAEDVLL